MDDQSRLLEVLAAGPADVGELARKINVARGTMFSLLMRMEKEGLIMWDGQAWVAEHASDHPPEGAGASSSGDQQAHGPTTAPTSEATDDQSSP